VVGVVVAAPMPLPPVEWDMDIEETEVLVGAGATSYGDDVNGRERETPIRPPSIKPSPLAV